MPFVGGLVTTVNVLSAIDGQNASWNVDLQYAIYAKSDGIYVRLRHDRTKNMRVRLYIFAQFNVSE